MTRRSRHQGFTLIEIMVTLVLVSILLGIGVPTFRDFIQSQRVRTVSYDMNIAFNFARSEAIKRNAAVKITPAATGWHDGWTIAVASDDTTLSQQMAYPAVTITGPTPDLTYGRDGRLTPLPTIPFEITGDTSIRCITFSLNGIPVSKKESCQ